MPERHALLSWAIWWAALCYCYPDRGEAYREAARHAQAALSFDPGDPWARMTAGLCLSTAGQHDHALGELRTAPKLNPSSAVGHMALGWALLRAGRFDVAIAETGQALSLSPLDSLSDFLYRHSRPRPSGRTALRGEFETCSSRPMTGFFRTGCCETGPEDVGAHVVCAEVTKEFLAFRRHEVTI